MKYRAWLIYDREGAAKNRTYIQMHKETGALMQIEIIPVVTEDIPDFFEYANEQKPDFAIVRTIQPALSELLESAGILVFNNSLTAGICNHKGKTFEYVQKNSNLPLIPSETFPNARLSARLLLAYPEHVIKAVDGHGGSQVFRTDEPFSLIRQAIGESDFVIQPFIRGPGKDIRLYAIGERIVGAVERQAKAGFRANYSLGGSVSPFLWGKREERWVRELFAIFSFGLVGIDFLVDEKGRLVFNEIEDVVGARMLYQCHPQIRLLEQYFTYILGKLNG